MGMTETAEQRPPRRYVAMFSKGPLWDQSLPLEEQAAFAGHAALMQQLARGGRVVDSGPFHQADRAVSGTEVGMAVFASDDPAEVARLLADDPVLAVDRCSTGCTPGTCGGPPPQRRRQQTPPPHSPANPAPDQTALGHISA